MVVALLVLCALNLLVVLSLLFAGRHQPAGLTTEQLNLSLGEAERRLVAVVAAARLATEAGLRQLQASGEVGRLQQSSMLTDSLDGRLARLEEAVTDFTRLQPELRGELQSTVLHMGRDLQGLLQQRLDGVTQTLAGLTVAHSTGATELRLALSTELGALGERLLERSDLLRSAVDARLADLRTDNADKLEKMRATVEEKLQSTLETRLGESFRTVSAQLEKVHQGLGEMQGLAQGVGDLKRVLTNVKSRGTFGETQLAALLEDVLAPDQYAANLVTRPGSDERVDFVVKLPGPELGGAPVLLPIDAKFPVEDYLRLQQAQDAADPVAAFDAQAALRLRLEVEARAIADKYLCSPQTTDFALLYLCTEGLYAEALRLGGLVDELQRRHRVTVVGPSTLAAFLSSLRAGFRTLAIQQRSSEVWQVLGAVKTEFHRFGAALDGVSKKLQEATNKVDALSARRRVVERTLRDVERLPEPEAAALLPAEATLEADQAS